MTWWRDFFDSLLFSNMLTYVGFKVSCLSTLGFFKLERTFMLVDLFRELLGLRFWYRADGGSNNCFFAEVQFSLFFRNLVSRAMYGFACWLVNFCYDRFGRSTWSDLLCGIPVFCCTWVRSNVLSLFIYFFLFIII